MCLPYEEGVPYEEDALRACEAVRLSDGIVARRLIMATSEGSRADRREESSAEASRSVGAARTVHTDHAGAALHRAGHRRGHRDVRDWHPPAIP